jgi:hypothetical protein
VYRRYASLFFIAGCDSRDNELITLEIVHRYVEQMDKYYGNVCELDIIFNFQKAYFILDELLLAGEMQESSKKNVLRCIGQQDSLEDMEVSCVYIPTGPFPLMSDPLSYAPMMSLTHVSSVRPRTTSLPRSCRRYDYVPYIPFVYTRRLGGPCRIRASVRTTANHLPVCSTQEVNDFKDRLHQSGVI